MKPNQLTPLRQFTNRLCAPIKRGARRPDLLAGLLATFLRLALLGHPAFVAISEGQELQCEPAPQGLVAWWPGDGNANDIVGTNHGALQNGTTFAPGKVGQAFSLDGIDDFVEIPKSSSLNILGAITIEAWIKPAQVTSGTIASKYDSSIGQLSWAFLIVDGGKLRFTLHGDGSYRYVDSADSVVVPGVFSHVAGTFDPVTQAIRIYVNGTEVAAPLGAGSTTVPSLFGSSTPVRLGMFVNSSSQFDGIFSGLIDEVSIFNRALDSNEIATIYAAGSAGMCGPGVPPCSNCPPAIVTQPVSLTTYVGGSASLSVTASGTAPLSYQWLKEGMTIPGATSASYQIVNAQTNDTGHYSVVVSNLFGSAMSSNALLAVLAQSLPDSFNPGTDGGVFSLAVQADGKILVGGQFTTLGGQWRENIGRLNANGVLDTSFNPAVGGYVSSFALQADGKILVGGQFTMLGGQNRNNIGRLNADGTLDTNFNPGASSSVESLASQPDGKILVGGTFTTLAGQARSYIGRLNADGTLDTNFNPAISSFVFSISVQPDGKIVVGGHFGALGGQNRNNIGRLNADGTLDTSFNPGTDPEGAVYCLALQPDGKILVGGYTTPYGQTPIAFIGRLNADGTLDTSLSPEAGGDYGYVSSLALQADGRIVLGGSFSALGGQTRDNISRLNADGTLDTSFNPGANRFVRSLAVQADGKILVGGGFSTLGGQDRNHIGRLNNTGPATQSLTFDGSTLTWSRGGTCPEIWRTTFEYSSDGVSWTHLGAGSRIPGLPPGEAPGWRLSGLAVSTNTTIRARGYAVGDSSWFVEATIGRLVIYEQPVSLTNYGGTAATFSIYAGGDEPLSYQWRKDDSDLADGGNVSGATTASLTMSNVLGGDAGGYSVVITSTSGSITSSVATLSVIYIPTINAQPISWTGNAGVSVTFSVSAAGTAPLNYQWFKNDGPLAGAMQSSLTLTNLQGSDTGSYRVVVSNAWGSVTSAVATLRVIDPVINVQPSARQAKNAGESVTFSVMAAGTAPLSYQWYKDGGLLVGATQSSLTLTNLDGSDAGSYRVVVSNAWGSVTSAVASLLVNLAVPDSFNPGVGGVGDDDAEVYSLAVQADGKIVVGGYFTTLGGQTRAYVGRLNADGTLDTSFNPGVGGMYREVYSLAVQADGKILVGGHFTTLGGQARTNIGRLNADGTLDTSFDPGAAGRYPFDDSFVKCLALQADGKILVGGTFYRLGGQIRNGIGRLNADGTVDTNFNPGANSVRSLALQPDGKILVGGYFTTLGGQSRTNIGRLNADGTLDTSLNPVVGGPNASVISLAVQADGKILLGGPFTTLGGQTRYGIGRLDADGTLDTDFNPGVVSYQQVNSLVLQADGKILVGGFFTTLGGQTRNGIGQLNADGTLDTSFNPGAGAVYFLALQADGKILVGGAFTKLGGQSRTNIGRLVNTEPATQSLTFDGSTLIWMRGGTSPEVWRTTFEYSPDGGNSWADLGAGIRIPGGWQLAGLALPTNATFRARGYGVGWLVESLLRSALAISDPFYSATHGQFGFRAAGPAGQVQVIEASSDLRTWTPLSTNTLIGAAPLSFSDPQAPLFPTRFYRLRSGP